MKEMKMVGGLPATENLRYGPQADLDYTVDENGNKIPEMTLGDVPPEPLTYYGMKRLEFLNKHKPIEAEISSYTRNCGPAATKSNSRRRNGSRK